MNPIWRNIILWVAIALLVFGVYQTVTPNAGLSGPTVPYSEFYTQVQQGNVTKAILQGDMISGSYKDNKTFRTLKPSDSAITDELVKKRLNR